MYEYFLLVILVIPEEGAVSNGKRERRSDRLTNWAHSFWPHTLTRLHTLSIVEEQDRIRKAGGRLSKAAGCLR
jgi:hypothetical protein